MQQSDGVREEILRFYERFSAGDAAAFAEVIADGEGVSVFGTGPGEGHDERDDWIAAYGQMMAGEMAGTRLRGNDPRAYAQASLGWGIDEPSFVFPDGSRLPTHASPRSCARMTATGRWSTSTSPSACPTSRRCNLPGPPPELAMRAADGCATRTARRWSGLL